MPDHASFDVKLLKLIYSDNVILTTTTTEESGRVTRAGQEETREANTEMGGLCKERCEEDRRGGRLEEEDRRQEGGKE